MRGHDARPGGRRTRIAAAGAEPYVGDPDRIGTLMDALDGRHDRVLADGLRRRGEPEQVAALHDGRLRMLCEKLVDTPVRGVVYEAAGSVPAAALDARARAGRARRGDVAPAGRAARGAARAARRLARRARAAAAGLLAP